MRGASRQIRSIGAMRDMDRGIGLGQIRWSSDGGALTTPASAATTANAVPHTVGAWVQAIAATVTEATCVYVEPTTASNTSVTDTSSLLSIGVGAAASEVAIATGIPMGYRETATSRLHNGLLIPVPLIPIGSRISLQIQSAVTLKAITFQVMLGKLPYEYTPRPPVVMGGANLLTTSRGVTLTAPGSTPVEGAWTEIIATTTQRFRALVVGIQGAASTNISNGTTFAFEVAMGSAGNEISIISDIYYLAGSGAETIGCLSPCSTFPVQIPAGTRLAGRYAASSLTSAADMVLIGIP